MLGGDPVKALGKARRLLAAGDASAALRLARKAQARTRGHLAGDLEALAEQARRMMVARAKERAEASTAEGYFADAAEWLRGALDHAGEDEREQLTARLHELELLGGAESTADAPEDFSPRAGSEGSGEGAGNDRGGEIDDEPARRRTGLEAVFGGGPHLEPPAPASGERTAIGVDSSSSVEQLYDAFVDSLRDDVAPRYRDRPLEFRRAVLDLGEQLDPEDSHAVIEALAADSPDDPVLRLERGRWRLTRGDPAGARTDLEAAWDALGDQPLDLAGLESIPEMWCEAALAVGDHAIVIERLEAKAELTLSDPELSLFYAEALLAAGEDIEAKHFLSESLERFPRRLDIAHLLAATLHQTGSTADAISVLEGSLRACGTGCAPSSLPPAVPRLLASLYLEAGGPLERLGDVLLLLRGAQGGALEPGDWMLQARYHELADEPAAATRARAHAAQKR